MGKISPAPWLPCFLMNHNGLNNLGRRSPKKTFLQNYIEIGPVVFDKKIIEVFFFWLPWQPEFLMDSKSLNNFLSVLPKAQFCEIWLKLAQWFRRRCCLKIVDVRTDGP